MSSAVLLSAVLLLAPPLFSPPAAPSPPPSRGRAPPAGDRGTREGGPRRAPPCAPRPAHSGVIPLAPHGFHRSDLILAGLVGRRCVTAGHLACGCPALREFAR